VSQKTSRRVNINALTDNQVYDEASGTAVVVGTAVKVESVAAVLER